MDDSGVVGLLAKVGIDTSILGMGDAIGEEEGFVAEVGGFIAGDVGVIAGAAWETEGVEEGFRFQKERNPVDFLSLVSSLSSELSWMSCLRSQPHSSFAEDFWDLTDRSHSIDPLEA